MADLHVRVMGIVQGVGFRWFVREQARRIGVAGWVRNRPDGSVEVLATGDDRQLQLLRAELERGPRGAVVEKLEEFGEPAIEPAERPFGIVR